ncbi:unnamed protein product, partial [Rodentolepis nana]|uniref:Uncharacterized protein n=1 Tax=Rodentolepis nana TaxID=102285 RepID=A0A0R3TGD7_RODNA
MTEVHNNNQQLKPVNMVKVLPVFKPESSNTVGNNTVTQSAPKNPVNVIGKRQIYINRSAKAPGATGTPVILPSGKQPNRCIQIVPQSSPTPSQMPTNGIEKQESPHNSSPYLKPKSTSPMKAFRSRRNEIIDNAMKRMAEKFKIRSTLKQSTKPLSLFLRKAIKHEEDEEEEDATAVVRSRMPIRVHPHANRRFSVLKYNKEDVELYSKEEVFLQRENNMDSYSKCMEKKPTYGGGSEFGADRRRNPRFRRQQEGSDVEEYS